MPAAILLIAAFALIFHFQMKKMQKTVEYGREDDPDHTLQTYMQ